MKKDQTNQLKSLGSAKTEYKYTDPTPDILETFQNQYPNRDYIIEYVFKEFTSLCPKTGQPDFAIIKIKYIANKLCIETKSLKVYFLAFRQHGAFMETIINQILEDCVAICKPRWMKVTSNFNARGGTYINIEATHHTNI